MAHYKLSATLRALRRELSKYEKVTTWAARWGAITFPRGIPQFRDYHQEMLIEMSFLRVFMAWEEFLEETFLLYLLGKTPPLGAPPQRIATPSTRKQAEVLITTEGRPYEKWTDVGTVIQRAGRYFRDSEPYSVLSSQTSVFNGMNTLRNAITHISGSSYRKFQSLIREKLRTYSSGLTVSQFLTRTVPGSSPPQSFFEYYTDHIRLAADRIVPVRS